MTKFLEYLNTKSVPVHQIPGGESGSGGRSGASWRKSDCTKVRKERWICIVLCKSEYDIKYEKYENFHFLSKPDTSGGTSWFNLAVKDNVEVMTETKRALGGQVLISHSLE